MHTLIIYDIENDRARNRIAEACKDYGLVRVQKSAFRGDLNTNRREMLFQRLQQTLGRQVGNIQVYALCERDARDILAIEQLGKMSDAVESQTASPTGGEDASSNNDSTGDSTNSE
jgi:CRISPR-associated protein Cas2